MSYVFSGHTVLITGGSCDMALCLAERMIGTGLLPVLSYRNAKGRKRIAKALAEYSQDDYQTCLLDLARPETIEQALASCGEGPDYLVDFAQGDLEALVPAVDSAAVTRYIQENITARAELLKATTRRMIRKRFGRLIFVSSAAALRPGQGQGFYAAAKRASEALYTNIALEMGTRGITSMSLRPGFVAAGRGRAFIERNKDHLIRQIPWGKWIEPQDVAETLCFLLSDAAHAFNATKLVMDGGLNAVKTIQD